MKLPEPELAKKLVQYLDYGVDHIEPGVRERLAAAPQGITTALLGGAPARPKG